MGAGRVDKARALTQGSLLAKPVLREVEGPVLSEDEGRSLTASRLGRRPALRPAEGVFPCLFSCKPYIEGMMPRHESLLTDLSAAIKAPPVTHAEFAIGDVVRHRLFDFRGVIFDVDPIFANSEEWYDAIPEDMRPAKDQPFYHLLAENAESSYVAYVSQQNLLPAISGIFHGFSDGRYELRREHRH